MIDTLLPVLEESGLAAFLRQSRWVYAGVNATHILGIALLIGSILPFDLHRLGAWPQVPREALARVLIPTAGAGLLLAVLAGVLLFSVRASEYIQNPAFLAKLALVAIGVINAAVFHLTRQRFALQALLSMLIWLAALASGRLIAFVD